MPITGGHGVVVPLDARTVPTARKRTILPETRRIVNLFTRGSRSDVPIRQWQTGCERTVLTSGHRYENMRSYRMSKREHRFAFHRTPAA